MIKQVDLRDTQTEIQHYAEECGLDFFQTIFENLDYDEISEVASYAGFPTRYPHWRFGMEYEELSKSYAYGLSKIYEMVINNDPCYAYLLNCNTLVDQKLVIAHVYAHSDFFKNNLWFSKTNRKMMDEMANHSTRVRRHCERHGENTVEEFVDLALSLDNLIDPHASFILRKELEQHGVEEEVLTQPDGRFKSKPYLDSFINPPEVIAEQKRQTEQDAEDKKTKFPQTPERDVLQFLLEHAPLDRWQRDILSIIREEAYYFVPQAQTKIMNEGWATFWHSKIMTEKCLTDAEIIDYADHHSGTLSTSVGRLNPYKLGVELFRDIEDRWNKGRFGKEYDECDDYGLKANWDKHLGLGRKKIFQVRHLYNDVMFIDAFLTPEFCREHKLFTFAYNEDTDYYEIDSREFEKIKTRILSALTNLGQPFIYVEDGNYLNRGELYLTHRHEGVELQLTEAHDTLVNLQRIWKRPVHLETVIDETKMLLSHNGNEFSETEID